MVFDSFCFFIALLHRKEVTFETLVPFNVMLSVGFYASQAAVLLMTIERSIIISKPLIWNEILPRKRMLLFMLCSWIVVVTSTTVIWYIIGYKNSIRSGLNVLIVWPILRITFVLSTEAVNIYSHPEY